MALQRSLLFVPGSEPNRIDAARDSVADVVVIDLEDTVSPEHKDRARDDAIQALADWDGAVGVRINGIDTNRGIADLEQLVASEARPDFVAVPDVRGPGDVQIVADALSGTESHILPLIERPSAVFHVYDIAHATPRIYGLLCAAIDFQMNMGMSVLGDSDISLLRYLVSMGAKSAGVLAFDKPLLVVDDEAALQTEIERAQELGYDGKLAVNETQAERINRGFLPSDAELAEARRIIEAFESSDDGLVDVGGTVVDRPVIEQLRARVALAERVE